MRVGGGALTGVEGAGGGLRGVENAADVGGAGGPGGGRRGQGGAGRVGGRGRALRLAVRDPAVADLPGLVLERRRVPHGSWPGRGGAYPRRLQGAVIPFGLRKSGESG